MTQATPQWQSGNPSKAGYYVIAILYENGMGTIGSDYWDSEQGWSLDDNIVGYIPLRQVLDAAGLDFPSVD